MIDEIKENTMNEVYADLLVRINELEGRLERLEGRPYRSQVDRDPRIRFARVYKVRYEPSSKVRSIG